MRTTYKWFDGELRDRDGFPLLNQEQRARPPQRPYVIHDINKTHEGPLGMITGGRAQRREVHKRMAGDFDKPTCDWEPVSNRPKGYASEKFAKKRKLKTSEATQEWVDNQNAKIAKACGYDKDQS